MIATAVIAAGSAAFGIYNGAKKNSEGKKLEREAQKRIDNFQWDELVNPYKTQQVSTLGANLQTEQNNITEASTVDALRTAGSRALTGGLGRIQYNSNFLNSKIAADLDTQRKAIDMAAAQDDARIRDIRYGQQANELAGLGQMLNTGMNMRYSGMADIGNGVAALGQIAGTYGTQLKGTGNTNSVNSTVPTNTTPTSGVSQNILNGGINYEAARQLSSILNQNIPDYSKIYGGDVFGNMYGGGFNTIGNN